MVFCLLMIQDIIYPKDRNDFRNWLFNNHNKCKGIWLVFFKKSSPKFNLSYSDARDEALCFGWIDSTVKKVDDNSRKQYFSPRKANSIWSKFNRNKVQELIERGLMTEYGLKVIEEAKRKGNYFSYSKVEELIIPKELQLIFNKKPTLKNKFENLSYIRKKHILHMLFILKTEEARKRKVNYIVNYLDKLTNPNKHIPNNNKINYNYNPK